MQFLRNLSPGAKIGLAVGAGVIGYVLYSYVTATPAHAATDVTPKPAGGGGYPDFLATSHGAMSTLDVQKTLNALGVPSPALKEDGINGPLTTAAVKQFQAQAGIGVDGIVGPQTVAAFQVATAQQGLQPFLEAAQLAQQAQATQGQVMVERRAIGSGPVLRGSAAWRAGIGSAAWRGGVAARPSAFLPGGPFARARYGYGR